MAHEIAKVWRDQTFRMIHVKDSFQSLVFGLPGCRILCVFLPQKASQLHI